MSIQRPNIGDTVVMSFMGADANIEIDDVPDEQPLVETDSAYIIVDQYGDEHIVEVAGNDDWSTLPYDSLSAEGQELWLARIEAKDYLQPRI